MLGLASGENSGQRRPYNGANEVYGLQLCIFLSNVILM